MRLVLIALAGLPMAAFAAPQSQVSPKPLLKNCAPPAPQLVARQKQPLTVRKLGQEPPAEGYMAVMRTVDGCEKPMKVRERR